MLAVVLNVCFWGTYYVRFVPSPCGHVHKHFLAIGTLPGTRRWHFPFGKAALKQGHRLNCQGLVPHPQANIAAGVPSPYVMLVSSGALCCTETLGMLCTCAAGGHTLVFLLVGIVCVRCSLCLLRHICRESQHLCAITSPAFSLP